MFKACKRKLSYKAHIHELMYDLDSDEIKYYYLA